MQKTDNSQTNRDSQDKNAPSQIFRTSHPYKWSSMRIFIALSTLATVAGCAGTQPSVGPIQPTSQNAPLLAAIVAKGADQPEDPADKGVASRITKVTVYSDRAMVNREASVSVSTEPTLFRFKKLPSWVDEGSVRASIDAGKIVDVSVERRFLARSSDEAFRTVESKHKALLEQLRAIDDELAILGAQKDYVDSIKLFSRDKLTHDVSTRDIKIETYGQVIDFVSETLRKTAASRRNTQTLRDRLAPDVEASARNLEELRRLTKLEETTVLVTVQGTAATNAKLTLTYATPGATWEPMHELRASAGEPDSVDLTSFAVVTQTTGEDWSYGELSFSTQSSSDTERIPELEMLALGKTEETTRTVTRQTTSFSSAQQKYVEQNRHWNLMNQAPSRGASELQRFEQYYSDNVASFERVQSKTVEIFQGLQKRGTTAHFVAKDPAIVRSDGRPIRLRIGNSRIQAQRNVIAAPEESLNAAVTLQMNNKTSQPLLPGGVARYRDGAFLGMTNVDFVAKGEDFSTFFSVADEVKLTRELDRKQSSLVRTTRNRMQLSFVTTARNLSDRPITLVLAERVPVSENTDIRVSNIQVLPNEKPDIKGIVRWTLTLKPHEARELRTSYQVEYPPTLVLDVHRDRARARHAAPPSPGAAPSSPATAPQRDLEDRILQFEKAL